jgi:hypothetical protein
VEELIVTSEVIVVVASVLVPSTVNVPLVRRFPEELAKKLVFSTQFEPSQRKVVSVALPIKTAPKIVFQYVEVPVLKRT